MISCNTVIKKNKIKSAVIKMSILLFYLSQNILTINCSYIFTYDNYSQQIIIEWTDKKPLNTSFNAYTTNYCNYCHGFFKWKIWHWRTPMLSFSSTTRLSRLLWCLQSAYCLRHLLFARSWVLMPFINTQFLYAVFCLKLSIR